MKTSPPKILAKYTHTTKHADDLDQLDLNEVDNEDAWLAVDDEEIGEEEPEVTPENITLYLPSNFKPHERKNLGWQEFGDMELQLREGQANDLLEKLRECLAEKSLRFRKELRSAKGQKKMTRAWDSIRRMEDQIKQVVVTYRAARDAIGELGKAADLERFQKITKSDLKMSGDIVEENRVGQRNSVLPWFWRLDRKTKGYCGDYEKECKCSNSEVLRPELIRRLVYRVNWLRARARAQRWNEEKEIVTKEMEWVVGTFRYMGKIWETRSRNMGNEKPGHRAYAMRETERWHRWAETANTEFGKVLG